MIWFKVSIQTWSKFWVRIFYRTKEKAPLIYFDSKNLSQNSGIKRYEIKLNDLTVASFKNDTKVLIKLAEVNKEIAKEAQNLDNLTVEFYDGAGDIKGRYQIRVDKERPEDIEYIVSSAEKTVPIKKFMHMFLNLTKELRIEDTVIFTYFLSGEIFQKINELLMLVHLFIMLILLGQRFKNITHLKMKFLMILKDLFSTYLHY